MDDAIMYPRRPRSELTEEEQEQLRRPRSWKRKKRPPPPPTVRISDYDEEGNKQLTGEHERLMAKYKQLKGEHELLMSKYNQLGALYSKLGKEAQQLRDKGAHSLTSPPYLSFD
jgi:hypothetical protein